MRDDLTNAIRSLHAAPASHCDALTVIACDVGAATTLYYVADAVVLRGLPFDERG